MRKRISLSGSWIAESSSQFLWFIMRWGPFAYTNTRHLYTVETDREHGAVIINRYDVEQGNDN